MPLDQYGQELDEKGYILAAVEAWRPFGIYPPPLAGIPTPLGVAQIKEARARWAEDDRSPEELAIAAHRFADEIDRLMGIDTRPFLQASKSL